MARNRQSKGEALTPSRTLDSLVASARRRLAGRWRTYSARLLVASGGCCQAVGAAAVAGALRDEVLSRGLPVAVVEAGCTGMCYQDVQVTLQRQGQPDVTWSHVEQGQAPALVDIAAGRRPITDGGEDGGSEPRAPEDVFVWAPEPVDNLPGLAQVPFLAGQRRVLAEHLGRVAPADVDEALVRGVYRGLARALSMSPEAVVEEVKRAALTGRGGAYFPAGLKWEGCRVSSGRPRYLVVNAEEGEPGVFKDRHLLEGDPHRVIEGALIAAYALEADLIFIYVNGLAHLARERLKAALEQAEARGLLGDRVLDTHFSCRVEVRDGGGGYVLGEETVLLESIEGRRAMPRIRPPYPVEMGLWGRPTAINNAETLANVSLILDRSAEWFTSMGTVRWPGTKLIAVSGDVARPGIVEVEMGTPLRTVLFDLAGGVPEGRALQAVLTGGPSGNLVPPTLLDTPLEPRLPDVLLGSGNLVALDETRPLLEVVRRLTRFNGEESCGKCTPCREGVNRMREILDRVAAGHGRPSDREDLLYLGDIAASASICGLGQMAPNPVVSALRHFRLPGL